MRMLNVSYKRGSSRASALSSVTNKDQAGSHDACSLLDIEDTIHGVLTPTLDCTCTCYTLSKLTAKISNIAFCLCVHQKYNLNIYESRGKVVFNFGGILTISLL